MSYCVKCGTRIPDYTRYCPRCGARAGVERPASELPCRFCQAYNRPDRTFCLSCSRRLVPLTAYDVTDSDFVCQADRDTLGMLQGTEPLPHIIDGLVTGGRERSMRSWLAANGMRVANRSRLDYLIRNCGEVLGLEALPESYVVPTPALNAATLGRDESPILVITSAALDQLDEREVMALVGHELGHVKSKHLLYHTLAESFGAGAQLLANFYGAGLVAMPIQMLLLSWHRESEVSADRAALLIVNDPAVFRSMMSKIAGAAGVSEDGGGSLSEAFQTHPTFGRRLALAAEFYASPEFARAKEKVRTRLRLRKALVPACRFCGAAKPITDLYCKACAKSQY
ncbi:MAG: M48 family metalloprotease [Nitrososphaerales archaeon]